MHVEVLSPKHHANWPDQIDWNGIVVHRPTTLPRRDWSMGRYVKHLSHWIETNCPSLDAIVAMSMREEAAAAVGCSRADSVSHRSFTIRATVRKTTGSGQRDRAPR